MKHNTRNKILSNNRFFRGKGTSSPASLHHKETKRVCLQRLVSPKQGRSNKRFCYYYMLLLQEIKWNRTNVSVITKKLTGGDPFCLCSYLHSSPTSGNTRKGLKRNMSPRSCTKFSTKNTTWSPAVSRLNLINTNTSCMSIVRTSHPDNMKLLHSRRYDFARHEVLGWKN